MGQFQKGGRGGFGGKKNFGGKSDFKRGGFNGGRDDGRGSSPMHKAPCDDCGNTAEVPFRPTGNKPVLCNDCFGGKKDGGNRKSSFDNRFENREPFGMKRHPDTGTFGPKKRAEHHAPQGSVSGLSKADIEKVVGDLHTKIDALTRLVEGFTLSQISNAAAVVEDVSNKIEKKAASIKAIADKKEIPKSSVKKVAVKKETKKSPTTVKKVATKEKAPAKKSVSKTTKKVAKKTAK